MASAIRDLEGPIPSSHTKYLDLLAKYYVLNRQHILAAHILYRLAERQCSDAGEAPTLEQRFLIYLVMLHYGFFLKNGFLFPLAS